MDNNLKKQKEIIYFGRREILNLKAKFKQSTLVDHIGITGTFLTLFTFSFLSISSLGMFIEVEESRKISLLPFYSIFVAGTLSIFGGSIFKESNKLNRQIALIEADIKTAQNEINTFHENELKHSQLLTPIEKEIGQSHITH